MKKKTADQETRDAPATLATFVDPEDGFRRTAIVIDDNMSVDLITKDGRRVCQVNAFLYDPHTAPPSGGEPTPLLAIVDVIVERGERAKLEAVHLMGGPDLSRRDVKARKCNLVSLSIHDVPKEEKARKGVMAWKDQHGNVLCKTCEEREPFDTTKKAVLKGEVTFACDRCGQVLQ